MNNLELDELIELVYECLATCKLVNVALFIASRSLGKDLKTLSEQTGIPTSDIESRVDYVEGQLLRHVHEYQTL